MYISLEHDLALAAFSSQHCQASVKPVNCDSESISKLSHSCWNTETNHCKLISHVSYKSIVKTEGEVEDSWVS